MPFEATWSAVQTSLVEGTKIPNWTAANGFLGDSFVVSKIAPTFVEVATTGAEMIQHVPSTEFAKVYSVWRGYCAGEVPRSHVRDQTRFSKYIISILRWLESQHGTLS